MNRKEIEDRLDRFQTKLNYCFREYEEKWIIDFVISAYTKTRMYQRRKKNER